MIFLCLRHRKGTVRLVGEGDKARYLTSDRQRLPYLNPEIPLAMIDKIIEGSTRIPPMRADDGPSGNHVIALAAGSL
jgi:hypothetical protein